MASLKTMSTRLGRLTQLSAIRTPSSSLVPSIPRRHGSSWSATLLRRSSGLAPRKDRLSGAPVPKSFSTSSSLSHGHIDTPKPGEELYVTFIDKDDQSVKLAVCEGDNLLDIAQAHDLDMEGACGGSCACSTCHVIVTEESFYERMPEPDDDENDMLDLAFGLTETSRLGCQVKMTKELDGMTVKLPAMTRNLQASDFNS